MQNEPVGLPTGPDAGEIYLGPGPGLVVVVDPEVPEVPVVPVPLGLVPVVPLAPVVPVPVAPLVPVVPVVPVPVPTGQFVVAMALVPAVPVDVDPLALGVLPLVAVADGAVPDDE